MSYQDDSNPYRAPQGDDSLSETEGEHVTLGMVLRSFFRIGVGVFVALVILFLLLVFSDVIPRIR